MRIITYNVNSLKQRLLRLVAMLDEHKPDIVCLQETKARPEAFPHDELRDVGYTAADHSGGRWEGVAVLGRTDLGVEPAHKGLPGETHPDQARWVEADVGGVRAVSVYVPNGRALGTETFADKLHFLELMAERANELAERPSLLAGDMNVCPTDLDVWNPAEVHGATHITPDERRRFQAVLDRGYTDAFRTAHPDDQGFTWWDYRAGHFHKGYGLRIDHVLLSKPLATKLDDAFVDRAYRKPTKVRESKASDHAPLVVDLAD